MTIEQTWADMWLRRSWAEWNDLMTLQETYEILSNHLGSGVPSYSNDGCQHDPSASQAAHENALADYSEVMSNMETLIEELKPVVGQMISAIDRIDNAELRKFLMLRYVQHKSLKAMCEHLHISQRTWYRRRNEALTAFHSANADILDDWGRDGAKI